MQRKRREEVAVIGLGRFGTSLALALMENGYDVLGIDQDPVIVQRIASDITTAAALDATDEDALREVDIGSFDTVVVAIGADFENNLMVTVALKSIGVAHVISKALTNRQRAILLRVGADRVVQPEYDAGRRLAEELMAPSLLERLPLGPQHSVAELYLPASLHSLSLEQADLRNRFGLTLLVIKRGEQLLVAPRGEAVLYEGDLLVLLGRNEALAAFANRR